jgi:hypothetical protein
MFNELTDEKITDYGIAAVGDSAATAGDGKGLQQGDPQL